jgi:Leucine-rich repeat (LRR) protein
VQTLRLGFLNIGPSVVLLNVDFSSLTTIFLQFNKITKVADDAFANCQHLKFLALQSNQIAAWPDLSYLQSLEFLDISSNKLAVQGSDYLPTSLLVLKLQGNPCAATDHKYLYRKDYVITLPQLEELDRLRILPAERLSH